MTRPLFTGSGLCSVFVLASLGACGGRAPAPPPDVPVDVARVVQRDVPLMLDATGTVEPVRSAIVAAQVDGILERVAFREGDNVRAGQVLFEIDPRPYRAALDQAEGVLGRDAAQAASADKDAERIEALAANDYVTAQQLDQARAAAAALAASLRADSAAVERARLNLQYATIRAPIEGRAGGLLLREGNLVRASAGTPLVVINQLVPILVRFAVPSTYLPDIRHHADRSLMVQATPVGATLASEIGTLTFIDNAVDSLTGTIQLKATFPNRDAVLWPGNLVRVRLQLDIEHGALVVPVTAVVSGQQGSFVYVVGGDRKAELRKVQVERSTDTISVLRSGVTAGETVVTNGQLRLTDGTRVAPRNESTAAADTPR